MNKKNRFLLLGLCCLFYINLNAQNLAVTRVLQETDDWCVAACVSSILAYYDINVSQCELKEYERLKEHYKIVKNNCCADANKCNRDKGILAFKEGSAEDMLKDYGAISTNFSTYPLPLSSIKAEIALGRPFIIGINNSYGKHAIVCHGVENDKLLIMDPVLDFQVYYTYDRYKSECIQNLTITCINEIEISGNDFENNKDYIYNAAQKFEILPNTYIPYGVNFQVDVTGTNCNNLCLAPSFQIVQDINGGIWLHVRNGVSYDYKIINSTGSEYTGNGVLTSNDQAVFLRDLGYTIHYVTELKINSECSTQRIIKGYEIPLWFE